MSVAEHLGRNLRKARRRAGMSQHHLSRATGLHHGEISMLERGLRIPRLDTVIRLTQGTGAGPEDLVGGITWHAPAGWDLPGWFAIDGVSGPAELRPPRGGR